MDVKGVGILDEIGSDTCTKEYTIARDEICGECGCCGGNMVPGRSLGETSVSEEAWTSKWYRRDRSRWELLSQERGGKD